MKKHRKKLIRLLAASLLMPGEEIEVITAAKLGNGPAKQNAAMYGLLMVVVVIMASLGAGVTAFMRPAATAQRYFVLTNRKLIMFGSRGPGGIKYLASVPRADVAASISESGPLQLRVQLNVAAPAKRSVTTVRLQSMRLLYSPLSPSLRRSGRQLVTSLQSGVAAEASPVEVTL